MCKLCSDYKPTLSERIGQAFDWAFSACVVALLSFCFVAMIAALYGVA